MEVNGLLVVILVTVAYFLRVLTQKNKKQQKYRKIPKSLFREFLLNEKTHIYWQLLEKVANYIHINFWNKLAPSYSFKLGNSQNHNCQIIQK